MEHVLRPELVQKEDIQHFRFPSAEVLFLTDQRRKRRASLEYALALGNEAFYKVTLVFEDEQGMKRVKTTVWDLTETDVILKNRTKVPIHRVHHLAIN